jgi:geranylgeranyl diphosphate synthase, type I
MSTARRHGPAEAGRGRVIGSGYRRSVGHTSTDRDAVRVRVETALAAFLRRQRTRLAAIDPALAQVADAIDGLVLGAGKRLRPAFGYWGYRGAGGPDRDEVVTALAALEFLQASALIHDDVMDASDTRRGEPAVHRRFADHHRAGGWNGDPATFGENAAILLGDLCLAWSDEMLHGAGVDPAALARARDVFDEMRTEVIVGQYLDVHAAAGDDISIERASKIATYKSAKYTVERPLLMGAALAGASGDITDAYSIYGLALGEAFQLRDDILGVFGDPAETGKPAGDDLREGKRTYLIATAFALSGAAEAGIMHADLGDPDLDPGRIERFREIISSSGALARTEARIDALTDEALAAIAKPVLAHDTGDALTELAAALVRRRR